MTRNAHFAFYYDGYHLGKEYKCTRSSKTKRMKWSEGAKSKSSEGTTPGTIKSNAVLHVNSVTRQTSVVPEEINSPHNGPRPKLRLDRFSPTNAMSPFAEGLQVRTNRLQQATQELDENSAKDRFPCQCNGALERLPLSNPYPACTIQ